MNITEKREGPKSGLEEKVYPIFEDLVSFIKNPRILDSAAPLTPLNFLLLLGGTLLLVVPYAVVMELVGVGQFDHAVEELLRNHKYLVLVATIVLAPLLEETAFRYHLNMKRKAIVWGLILSILLVSQMWWLAVVVAVYFISLFVLVSMKKNVPLHLVVYVSAVLFGLIHMGNFRDFDWLANFYWVPFLVGIQFGLGLLLSFIRLHHGMWKAIYFHAAYNAVLVVPAVLFGFD